MRYNTRLAITQKYTNFYATHRTLRDRVNVLRVFVGHFEELSVDVTTAVTARVEQELVVTAIIAYHCNDINTKLEVASSPALCHFAGAF